MLTAPLLSCVCRYTSGKNLCWKAGIAVTPPVMPMSYLHPSRQRQLSAARSDWPATSLQVLQRLLLHYTKPKRTANLPLWQQRMRSGSNACALRNTLEAVLGAAPEEQPARRRNEANKDHIACDGRREALSEVARSRNCLLLWCDAGMECVPRPLPVTLAL